MARTKQEKSAAVRAGLTKDDRRNLYQAARLLDEETRARLGLTLECQVYLQDPSLPGRAQKGPKPEPQPVQVRWEPSLGEGPTSARLAVVDYDGDTGVLHPPAVWDQKAFAFVTSQGETITEATAPVQFRQVAAWAMAEQVLEYFEGPSQLGRPIPWGFEGNRLLIVPQAGWRENAFYDRHSKSLQLYYYGDRKAPRYTALSHDIVSHEMGHALLDGIRPGFLETSSWETAAFHEFFGDLTTILLAFRNNDFRRFLQQRFGTDLSRATDLAAIGEEFATYTDGRPFLRSALDPMTYDQASKTTDSHDASQTLAGTMYDILTEVAGQYLSEERQAEREKAATAANALWWAATRMGGLALQALDLLPPVDVRFADYAQAILRHQEIADPEDRHGYREILGRVFHRRGLCSAGPECDAKSCPLVPPEPERLEVVRSVAEWSRSKVAAYHLLHDNRRCLGIPADRDFVVCDLYDNAKLGPGHVRLPRQIVLQYRWNEEIRLTGERFGRFQGEIVPLLCGGTLVFDDAGNLLWQIAKPGRSTAAGQARETELLDYLAGIVAQQSLARADDLEVTGLTGLTGAVVARREGGALRLESPHHLCGRQGEREEWTTSF